MINRIDTACRLEDRMAIAQIAIDHLNLRAHIRCQITNVAGVTAPILANKCTYRMAVLNQLFGQMASNKATSTGEKNGCRT
jgi:hypothetical protein